MQSFYDYLINAGISETASSWGCVFVLVAVVIGVVAIICRLLPRRK